MTETPQRWCLVLPVKRFSAAKSRLAALAGADRGDLALAFALDTARAVLACPRVQGLVTVTDEPAAAAELERLGATVVADRPDAGLNPALAHGADVAARLAPGCGVGAVSSDLPALRPADLGAVLAVAPAGRPGFVADAEGTGTTLLLSAEPGGFRPRFGPASASRHADTGAVALPAGASVRRDVDTPRDLAAAAALGLGPRTLAVLARVSPGRFGAPGPAGR